MARSLIFVLHVELGMPERSWELRGGGGGGIHEGRETYTIRAYCRCSLGSVLALVGAYHTSPSLGSFGV